MWNKAEFFIYRVMVSLIIKFKNMNREEIIEKIKKTEMYYMISKHFDNETVDMMIEELVDALHN